MKRIYLILVLLITTISYAPPKQQQQQDNFEMLERNYNKAALVSGALLFTSAALNYNRIMLSCNHYYLAAKPYLNQQNFSKSSFVLGSLLAMPLLYIKFRKKDENK